GADLGAGLGGGLDQDLVQHPTTDGRVAPHHARVVAVQVTEVVAEQVGGHRTGQPDAVVDHVHVDVRRGDRGDLVQQAPAVQVGHAVRPEEVRRDDVGGKGRPVHHEHPVATAGEQQCGGGARATGTDHYRVVHVVLDPWVGSGLPSTRPFRRGPAQGA